MASKFVTSKGLSEIKQKYDLGPVLGTGAYGTVRECTLRETGEAFACKTILKSRVDDIDVLENEIMLLRTVRHPHIIELEDVYEDEEQIHIITELCTGGELYDRVIEKAESDEQHHSEEDAATMMRDILSAIEYVHSLDIAHRDLKPENFLLKSKDSDEIKIIDFGLSRKVEANQIMKTRVGTPYYVAPEVLSQDQYTSKCDIWSIGVITYILLCGFPPFSGDDDFEVIAAVSAATSVDFPSPEWDDISDMAKDFCRCLLRYDAKERPTATEALGHDWLKYHARASKTLVEKVVEEETKEEEGTDETEDKATDMPVSPPKVPAPKAIERVSSSIIKMDGQNASAFRKFLAGSKIKKRFGTIVDTLTPGEASSLGKIFKKVDSNNDGHMDADEIDKALESTKFSSSVKRNLTLLRQQLSVNTKVDVRPFVLAARQKAKEPH